MVLKFVCKFSNSSQISPTSTTNNMIKNIESASAPPPIGPYSQGIAFGNQVWVSGCIALRPGTDTLVQDTIEDETEVVMENLKAIVEASGSSMAKIVKTTIFLTDMKTFPQVNQVYGSYFVSPYPARETVEVSALPKGARVEISCVTTL
jgi:2-iminobutanoate/2-iminopropanoate deaminase